MKYSMDPIVGPNSAVLILGSMPGERSLELRQYYAHPQNHFWPLLGRIFAEPVGASYDERVRYILAHRLALWDVIASCEREGSLDSAISDEEPNDFAWLFASYTGLRYVALNGRKAYDTFESRVWPALPAEVRGRLQKTLLPSSSPIPTRAIRNLDQKTEAWRVVAQWARQAEGGR